MSAYGRNATVECHTCGWSRVCLNLGALKAAAAAHVQKHLTGFR